MSTISVIVPVYKVEPYLAFCVNSILEQTYTDFELILIDDGSPDNCGAICDEYASKDNRVHVIHQQNGGLSAARNAGIDWVFANSDSNWITFIDSDDLVSNAYLECMLTMAEEAQAQVVSVKPLLFRDEEELTLLNTVSGKTECISGLDSCLRVYSIEPEHYVDVVAWGKLFQRELLRDIRFPVGKIHEDQGAIPLILYQASRVVWMGQRLYGYRQRTDSIMGTKTSLRRMDELDNIETCCKFFLEQGEREVAFAGEQKKLLLLGKYVAALLRQGTAWSDIPKHYRRQIWNALWTSKRLLPENVFEYRLGSISKPLARFYEYWKKVRNMICTRCL